jgi:hypothetical protein
MAINQQKSGRMGRHDKSPRAKNKLIRISLILARLINKFLLKFLPIE